MSTNLQFKRDSAANWLAIDPVLNAGTPGLDTTSKRLKIGDGVLKWSLLPYYGYYESGNLTSADGIITITGGTGCVLGTGAAMTLQIASAVQPGVISAADWALFNGKYAGLPSQAGKTGKFLMSNGVTESWQDAPVDASSSLNKAFVVGMATAMGGRR